MDKKQSHSRNRTIANRGRPRLFGEAGLIQKKETRSPEELKFLPKAVLMSADEHGLGTLLWVHKYPLKWMGKKVYVFEEGVIQTGGFLFFTTVEFVYAWSKVCILRSESSEYMRYDSEIGSVYSEGARTFEMEFSEGRKCTIVVTHPGVRTLSRDFFRYGKRQDYPMSHAERVGMLIDRKIALAQFVQIRQTLETGGEVNFGRITATLEGVSFDGQSLPWNGIRAIESYLPTSDYAKALLGRFEVRARGCVLQIDSGDASESEEQNKCYRIPACETYNLVTLQKLRAVMTSDIPLTPKSTQVR